MEIINVSYLVTPAESEDEAQSLTYYLNEHGICAFVQGEWEVSCPLEKPDLVPTIELLKNTWRMFWDYSDSGLFGLPCYTKD